MARTRSGQGSHSGGQGPRRGPRNLNQAPPTGNEGNNNPPPVTLEAIQKHLRDAQVQNRVEMHNIINERLGDSSRTLSITRSDTPKSVFRSHSPTQARLPTPPPPPSNPPLYNSSAPKECTFQRFYDLSSEGVSWGERPKDHCTLDTRNRASPSNLSVWRKFEGGICFPNVKRRCPNMVEYSYHQPWRPSCCLLYVGGIRDKNQGEVFLSYTQGEDCERVLFSS